MNILFVTLNGIEDDAFGGAKASIRNYNSLKKYGNVTAYEIKKHSNIKSALSCLQGNMPPILNDDIKNINNAILKNKIDLCFLDSSWLGSVCINISKPCITFFHNCESDYNRTVRFGNSNSLKKAIYQKLVDKNELRTIKASDKICTFTERDSSRLLELYGRAADFIIPLSIVDKYKNGGSNSEHKEKSVLLFGPSGTANDEAFLWFAKNVSPHINVKTIIAGKGMEKFEYLSSEKIEVIGYVASIQDLYSSVSCVAIPLLSGGGMKIKTAEALMFGKYVFGTKEAFVGYEDKLSDDIAMECRTADDFIEAINAYFMRKPQNFNYKARETYLENFSPEATQGKFDELVASLDLNRM